MRLGPGVAVAVTPRSAEGTPVLRVSRVTLQPPAILPESMLASSSTNKDQVPLGLALLQRLSSRVT